MNPEGSTDIDRQVAAQVGLNLTSVHDLRTGMVGTTWPTWQRLMNVLRDFLRPGGSKTLLMLLIAAGCAFLGDSETHLMGAGLIGALGNVTLRNPVPPPPPTAALSAPALASRKTAAVRAGGRWPRLQPHYDAVERETAQRTGSARWGWLRGQVLEPTLRETVLPQVLPLSLVSAGWALLLDLPLMLSPPVAVSWGLLTLAWHLLHRLPGPPGHPAQRAFSLDQLTISGLSFLLLFGGHLLAAPTGLLWFIHLLVNLSLPHLAVNIWGGMNRHQVPLDFRHAFDSDFELEQRFTPLAQQQTLFRIQEVVNRLLTDVQHLVEAGVIDPQAPLGLQAGQATMRPRAPPSRRLRLGIYPLTGDPLTWAHLCVMLSGIVQLRLDKLIVISQGRSPRKPQASDERARFAMIRAATKRLAPLVEFSDIGSNSDVSSEANLLTLLEARASLPIDAYDILSDEYLRTRPRMFADLLAARPLSPSHTLALAFTARVMAHDSLRDALRDAARPGLPRMLALPDPLSALSSTAFRRGPDQPLVPHAVRREIWSRSLYGSPRLLEAAALVGPLQFLTRHKPDAVAGILQAVSPYLTGYPGVGRWYLEFALKEAARAHQIHAPEVVATDVPRGRGVTLLFPEVGGQVDLVAHGSDITAQRMRYVYRSSLTPEEEAALLDRPVTPEPVRHRESYAGTRILVTGAAGSIAGALIEALSSLPVDRLILVDWDGLRLERLEGHLRARGVGVVAFPVDVRNASALERAFQAHRPHIVFHTAAFKFSDLAELPLNRTDVHETNVGATRTVLSLADRFRAERVVVFSSDKAADPIGVYGRSKLEVERLVQGATSDASSVIAVRAPNILGSTGSVIPIVEHQLHSGMPVALFDPEPSRFFLTGREVAAVVLNAVMEAPHRSVVVLKPNGEYRINDLLVRLAALRGAPLMSVHRPHRPGDKLREMLLTPEEEATASDSGAYWVLTSPRQDDQPRQRREEEPGGGRWPTYESRYAARDTALKERGWAPWIAGVVGQAWLPTRLETIQRVFPLALGLGGILTRSFGVPLALAPPMWVAVVVALLVWHVRHGIHRAFSLEKLLISALSLLALGVGDLVFHHPTAATALGLVQFSGLLLGSLALPHLLVNSLLVLLERTRTAGDVSELTRLARTRFMETPVFVPASFWEAEQQFDASVMDLPWGLLSRITEDPATRRYNVTRRHRTYVETVVSLRRTWESRALTRQDVGRLRRSLNEFLLALAQDAVWNEVPQPIRDHAMKLSLTLGTFEPRLYGVDGPADTWWLVIGIIDQDGRLYVPQSPARYVRVDDPRAGLEVGDPQLAEMRFICVRPWDVTGDLAQMRVVQGRPMETVTIPLTDHSTITVHVASREYHRLRDHTWDVLLDSVFAFTPPPLAHEAINLMQIQAGDRVVVLGAGTGLEWLLAMLGFTVWLVDPRKDVFERSAKNSQALSPLTEPVGGSVTIVQGYPEHPAVQAFLRALGPLDHVVAVTPELSVAPGTVAALKGATPGSVYLGGSAEAPDWRPDPALHIAQSVRVVTPGSGGVRIGSIYWLRKPSAFTTRLGPWLRGLGRALGAGVNRLSRAIRRAPTAQVALAAVISGRAWHVLALAGLGAWMILSSGLVRRLRTKLRMVGEVLGWLTTSSRSDETITRFHHTMITKVPLILRYGFLARIGVPTFGDSADEVLFGHFHPDHSVVLVLNVARRLLDPRERLDAITKRARLRGGFPNALRRELEEMWSDPEAQAILTAATTHRLGKLDASTIDIENTLAVNHALWEKGFIAEATYQRLQTLLHPRRSDPSAEKHGLKSLALWLAGGAALAAQWAGLLGLGRGVLEMGVGLILPAVGLPEWMGAVVALAGVVVGTVLPKIGRRLRQVREAQGFTQEALARRSRLHELSVLYIEQGRAGLLATWVRLAQALRVNLWQLLDVKQPLPTLQRRRPVADVGAFGENLRAVAVQRGLSDEEWSRRLEIMPTSLRARLRSVERERAKLSTLMRLLQSLDVRPQEVVALPAQTRQALLAKRARQPRVPPPPLVLPLTAEEKAVKAALEGRRNGRPAERIRHAWKRLSKTQPLLARILKRYLGLGQSRWSLARIGRHWADIDPETQAPFSRARVSLWKQRALAKLRQLERPAPQATRSGRRPSFKDSRGIGINALILLVGLGVAALAAGAVLAGPWLAGWLAEVPGTFSALGSTGYFWPDGWLAAGVWWLLSSWLALLGMGLAVGMAFSRAGSEDSRWATLQRLPLPWTVQADRRQGTLTVTSSNLPQGFQQGVATVTIDHHGNWALWSSRWVPRADLPVQTVVMITWDQSPGAPSGGALHVGLRPISADRFVWTMQRLTEAFWTGSEFERTAAGDTLIFSVSPKGWKALPEWLKTGLQVTPDGRLWIRFRPNYLSVVPGGRQGPAQPGEPAGTPSPIQDAGPVTSLPFRILRSAWSVVQRVAPLIFAVVLALGASLAFAFGTAVPLRPASVLRRPDPGPASSAGNGGEGETGSRRRTRPFSRASWLPLGWWRHRRTWASAALTIRGARPADGRVVELMSEAQGAIWEWLLSRIHSPPGSERR